MTVNVGGSKPGSASEAGRGTSALGELVFVSLMADNAAFLHRALAAYVAQHLDATVRFEESVPWQEREQMLLRGEAHVGVVCGLQYVYSVDRGDQPGLEPLAAPVMSEPRYGGRPVYFSDVLVRADSAIQSFADLRGAIWAYNEPTSQSGYNLTRYVLARRAETSGFFGRVIEAGSHEQSLALLLDGEIDAAAIDSTVLDQEHRTRPLLASQVRVIETFGPSPIPPYVASRSLSASQRAALRTALLTVHERAEGASLLNRGGVSQFVPVVDADYDPIRTMARIAAAARL